MNILIIDKNVDDFNQITSPDQPDVGQFHIIHITIKIHLYDYLHLFVIQKLNYYDFNDITFGKIQ